MKYYITKFIKDFRRPRFVLSFDETLDRPVVLVLWSFLQFSLNFNDFLVIVMQ